MFPIAGRVWNTWDGATPVAFCHLRTGLTVRVSAYSSKASRYLLPGAGDVRLGEHQLDGSRVRCILAFEGSQIEVTFGALSDFDIGARARVLSLGEWGLRLWFAFEIGFAEKRLGPAPYVLSEPRVERAGDPSGRVLLQARYRSAVFAIACAEQPSFCGLYPDAESYGRNIGESGYYMADPEESEGRWSALRFNAQMHPEVRIAVAHRTDAAAAASRAAQLLADPAFRAVLEDSDGTGADGAVEDDTSTRHADAAAQSAVRDVVGWNTVWDHVHARPTTVLTRNWLSGKFGGWGVWLDDMLFHSILASSCGDFDLARANLDAALDSTTPAGNLACLVTQTQEWVDRSQPPIASYALWRLYDRTRDTAMLQRYLPVLLRAHDWWFAHRDGNRDGLLEYGSSDTGNGAFVGTKQAAMDESFMDNSPMFDFAEFDAERRTLDVAEPGLNSLVSLEGQLLARMARVLGDSNLADCLESRSAALNALISRRLWDPSREVFAARNWSGEFSRSLTPTSFYPLICGAATPEQQATLIERHLRSPDKFWGERVLPASTFDDPATADNVYWRGRVWAPHLLLVWEGLRRAEAFDIASAVADAAWRMFEPGWTQHRRCMENYHVHAAGPDESPDADPFYTWGALCALLPCLEVADSSPWGGLVFAPGERSAELLEPGRRWQAVRSDGGIRILLNGAGLLRAQGAERLWVDLAEHRLTVRADAQADVTLDGVRASNIVYCTVDDRPVQLDGGEPVSVTVEKGSQLMLWARESLVPGQRR